MSLPINSSRHAALAATALLLAHYPPAFATNGAAPPAPPAPPKPIHPILTGRNDPCPCGSGKKYKRCHRGTTLD